MLKIPNDVLRYFCPTLNAKAYLYLSTSSDQNMKALREKRTRKGMRQLLRYVAYERGGYVVNYAPSGNRDGLQCAYDDTGSLWCRCYFKDGGSYGLSEYWREGVLESLYSFRRGKQHGIVVCSDGHNRQYVGLYRDNKLTARIYIDSTYEKTIAKAYYALLAAEAVMKESD